MHSARWGGREWANAGWDLAVGLKCRSIRATFCKRQYAGLAKATSTHRRKLPHASRKNPAKKLGTRRLVSTSRIRKDSGIRNRTRMYSYGARFWVIQSGAER